MLLDNPLTDLQTLLVVSETKKLMKTAVARVDILPTSCRTMSFVGAGDIPLASAQKTYFFKIAGCGFGNRDVYTSRRKSHAFKCGWAPRTVHCRC